MAQQFPNTSHNMNYHFKKQARSKANTNEPVVPCYRDYQLIGDSQLLRFSEQMLGFKVYLKKPYHRSRRLGYCIAGQRISDLRWHLVNHKYKLSKKVIMLIGMHDILYKVPINAIIRGYAAVLSYLKEQVDQIIILTVPFIPKLVSKCSARLKLQAINQFINGDHGEKVSVLDAASLYFDKDKTVPLENYEWYIRNNPQNIDLIHLNKRGFQLLKNLIDEYLDKNA